MIKGLRRSFIGLTQGRTSWCVVSIRSLSQANSNIDIDSIIENYFPNGERPTEKDINCVSERQLDHPINDVIVIDKIKCKHGYPRAYVYYPLGKNKKYYSGHLRLTCPLLVKAIDDYEDNGGIREINLEVAENPSLKINFAETNAAWINIRRECMTPSDVALVKQRYGDNFDQLCGEAGILGLMSTDDVKCLHAHVADHIMRGCNKIGEIALATLENKGVEINGCAGAFI